MRVVSDLTKLIAEYFKEIQEKTGLNASDIVRRAIEEYYINHFTNSKK